MIFKIFALFIVACVASSYGRVRHHNFPHIEKVDPNDPELLDGLKKVLKLEGSTSQVVKVFYATKALAAGYIFVALFVIDDGRACIASWMNQPWISRLPQYVEFLCP